MDELTIIDRIAMGIAEVGNAEGWKVGRKADENRNQAMWAGAYLGSVADKGEDHKDTQWILKVVVLLVVSRSPRETYELAAKAKAKAPALNSEGPKVASDPDPVGTTE